MRLVQLEGFAHRYPSQLSGGQRQRMALARALAVEPEVLLLDEPFGALDAKVRKELRDWLRRLHDEVHVTTIFVTHDQEEAMDVAEQIVVMNEGRIEQAGPPTDLYEHPATEFVMGFVGPVNRRRRRFIRPHDLEILHVPEPRAPRSAMIERIVHLGFEVRVELCSPTASALGPDDPGRARGARAGGGPDRLRAPAPPTRLQRRRAHGDQDDHAGRVSAATAVSPALLAVLVVWLAVVVAATWRQLLDEVDADALPARPLSVSARRSAGLGLAGRSRQRPI